MKTDIEIAQANVMDPIERIARKAKIDSDALEYYGKFKAKINLSFQEKIASNHDGKLILVTAITPTKAGEGKSTITVGLVDGLSALNKHAIGCMREPSLGPVFGLKGGATGGGNTQVVPMDEINLHFTGDMHAVTAANNLVSAVLDNHIWQGNELGIDPDKILWKRCLDMNDRALRNIDINLDDKKIQPRREHFQLTVASQMMAILCLAKDMKDFRQRIEQTIVAFTFDDRPITINDLQCVGSIIVLMKDAIKPNLVQTLEKNPILIHGGPFANIAHGANSIIATKMALKLADFVVTEAGFGSDLGAQKFMDITCPTAGMHPSVVVLVATVRALKMHGGQAYDDLKQENTAALKAGLPNLAKHVENIRGYGVQLVVAVNKFLTDTSAELAIIKAWCLEHQVPFALNESWEQGSQGALALAHEVITLCEKENKYHSILNPSQTIQEKLDILNRKIYGGDQVVYTELALQQLDRIKALGLEKMNVCVAKTQSSLSDDPKLLGRPEGVDLHVRELQISSGAGFIVAICGTIMTMPGLPKVPAAVGIDIDEHGRITGLF
ncbi:MAG: formate--tetrahydrofolate ligase [Erysipelotrichaceae bacterium]